MSSSNHRIAPAPDPAASRAPEGRKGVDRRTFLKVVGIAGTTTAVACDPKVPVENVLPYVVQPDQIVPGLSTWYATRCNECSAGCGVLARDREGRVVKLEGNPEHPVNQGKLCARGEAAVLATYSADRFIKPRRAGKEIDWDTAIGTVADGIKAARAAGKQIAWLGARRTGAMASLLNEVSTLTGMRRVHWEPLDDDALRAATRKVFGEDGVPAYVLDDARTIVSFGADFLQTWGNPMPQVRGFANSRDPEYGGFVSRFVAIEPRIGTTSALADVHLAPKPGSETAVALALARLLADRTHYSGPAARLLGGVDVDGAASASGIERKKLEQVADWMAKGPSVVLPGAVGTAANPTDLATATLLLNEVAGNVGKTVVFGPTLNMTDASSFADVKRLLDDCRAGKVGLLFLEDLDPVYNLPEDAGARAALNQVGLLVAFADEPTDSLTDKALVLPPGSTLERWDATEQVHGVYTLQQPAMGVLYDTKSTGDVLLAAVKQAGLVPAAPSRSDAAAAGGAALLPADANPGDATSADGAAHAPAALPEGLTGGLGAPTYKDYVAAYWKTVVWPRAGRPGKFADFWTSSLQRGGWFQPAASRGATFALDALPPAGQPANDVVLSLVPHPFIFDGRHANKTWAQEVPEPISTITWGTWAELSPATARKLGIDKEDGIVVSTAQGEIEIGWFESPGIRDDVIAVFMGNGHERSGRYTRFGKNPVRLLTTSIDRASGGLRYAAEGAKVRRSGKKSPVHIEAGSMYLHGRTVNYTVSVEDLGKGEKPGGIVPREEIEVPEGVEQAHLTTMYPMPDQPTYRFAMAIDLNRCVGCGACETACYSENNIPVVGPHEVALSRRMGWIRLDRFWQGKGEHPDIRFQPVMCVQCTFAPCEGVCPVVATYHNLDGLNAMVYNRCVGTRYCANNCPWSARRFNYHTYRWPESYNLMLNPDVVTRDMGVMEKCTFCIQRIRDIKDQYRDDHHKTVPDEALHTLTACAQACPADAIRFGNLKDPNGLVTKKFGDERAFTMLEELNTRPGLRYLARINHVPSMMPEPAAANEGADGASVEHG